MIPLLQAYTLSNFSEFIGIGIVQAMGGSLFLIGILILLGIAFISWKMNLHITGAFFLSFLAISFLNIYFNDAGFNDIGLFGTLYNVMLFGMAIIFLMVINDMRK